MRDGFLRLVAQQARPGLVHRTAVAVQHDLLKNRPVAVGPGAKYSRGQPKRRGRRL
jgi:hypothetical protein